MPAAIKTGEAFPVQKFKHLHCQVAADATAVTEGGSVQAAVRALGRQAAGQRQQVADGLWQVVAVGRHPRQQAQPGGPGQKNQQLGQGQVQRAGQFANDGWAQTGRAQGAGDAAQQRLIGVSQHRLVLRPAVAQALAQQ